MEDFFKMLSTRQSCRNYDKAKPVEKDKLMQCVEAGRLAPSACNSQPWHFHAVTDADAVSLVRKAVMPMGANSFAKAVNAFIVVTQERPNVPERTAELLFKHGFPDIDIGISTAHIVLAAESVGLSTCILGLYDEKELKSVLKLYGKSTVKLVIAVGYCSGDDPIRPKKRKELEEVCTVL